MTTFKQWLEIFGQAVDLTEPVQYPKLTQGARPTYEVPDLPDPLLGKSVKRMKKKKN